MKAIACDSDRDYFFCSANLEEYKTQLIPFRKALEDKCRNEEHLRWPNLFVSTEETMEKELAAQALVKANPYQSKTILFHDYTDETPDAYIYFIINQKLNELYFVPFDIIYPERWGKSNPWGALDKFEFKKVIQIATKPMTFDHGRKHPVKDPWTDVDHDDLVEELSEKVKTWKSKGPEYVFRKVYPYFQQYRIFVEDLHRLFAEGGVAMDREFFSLDQEHMHVVADWFEPKRDVIIMKRTWQEEDELCMKKDSVGVSGTQIYLDILFDYLDQIIDWDTVMKLTADADLSKYENMDDETRRKKLWLNHPKGDAVVKSAIE